MVMTKSVAAKPSSTSTSTLPFQPLSRFSSMAIEPCPAKLRPATWMYTGSAPSMVTRTRMTVAIGATTPAASSAIPGW